MYLPLASYRQRDDSRPSVDNSRFRFLYSYGDFF